MFKGNCWLESFDKKNKQKKRGGGERELKKKPNPAYGFCVT